MVIAVADLDGKIIDCGGWMDATVFSIDVAATKARTWCTSIASHVAQI